MQSTYALRSLNRINIQLFTEFSFFILFSNLPGIDKELSLTIQFMQIRWSHRSNEKNCNICVYMCVHMQYICVCVLNTFYSPINALSGLLLFITTLICQLIV